MGKFPLPSEGRHRSDYGACDRGMLPSDAPSGLLTVKREYHRSKTGGGRKKKSPEAIASGFFFWLPLLDLNQ